MRRGEKVVKEPCLDLVTELGEFFRMMENNAGGSCLANGSNANGDEDSHPR